MSRNGNVSDIDKEGMMKKAVIFLSLIFMTSFCFGDFYVLYKQDTGEIVNMADNEKAFVIASSDKDLAVKKFKGDFLDYEINKLTDYKVSGDKIVVNTQKVSDETAHEEEQRAIAAERKIIDKKLVDIAIDALKADGITLEYFSKTGE
jgi:hypothetical protein